MREHGCCMHPYPAADAARLGVSDPETLLYCCGDGCRRLVRTTMACEEKTHGGLIFETARVEFRSHAMDVLSSSAAPLTPERRARALREALPWPDLGFEELERSVAQAIRDAVHAERQEIAAFLDEQEIRYEEGGGLNGGTPVLRHHEPHEVLAIVASLILGRPGP